MSNWPDYEEDEISAAVEVLRSGKVNYWTGKKCREFEDEFAKYVGTEYAIAVANGTVALDLALLALDVGPGDEVIVTSRTFLASVSAIINSGATPIFADVCVETQNITANTIKTLISEKTKAVICVHLAGWPCEMDPIMSLAEQHNLTVIEDCAQAHGAEYKGRRLGSIGHIGCWSFCQDKIMSTGGEGGMVTTNNKSMWSKMWSYKDHGKSWEAVYEKSHPPGFRWLHESFGTNWRMTEMQAAIGICQLKKLDDWIRLRQRNHEIITRSAKNNINFRVPNLVCDDCTLSVAGVCKCRNAAYKCYLFVNGDEEKRDKILDKLRHEGIQCFTGSCSEVYMEKAFEGTEYLPPTRLQNAKELGETSVMFLCDHTISEEELNSLCKALIEL